MKKQKKYLIALVLVAGAIAYWAVGQEDGAVKMLVDNLNLQGSPEISQSAPTPTSSGMAPRATAVGAQVTPFNSAYTVLVQEYADRRIQFGAACQATPTNSSFRSGTKIMLDNRSGDARVISVGGTKYNFPGYGYLLITLSSKTLPKTLSLNCGAAVNVGTITLN